MILLQLQQIAITMPVEAADEFVSESHADHEKSISKLDAESECRDSAIK